MSLSASLALTLHVVAQEDASWQRRIPFPTAEVPMKRRLRWWQAPAQAVPKKKQVQPLVQVQQAASHWLVQRP
jgi:hypothetical protein